MEQSYRSDLANARPLRYRGGVADGPENLTLRILQEIRDEVRELRAEMEERFTDLTQRVDGNTLVLNLVAGMVHDHKERISQLEGS